MGTRFQHGLSQLDTVAIAAVLILTGLAVAAIWNRIGLTAQRRSYESLALIVLSAVTISGCTLINTSWDNSENRNNSFPQPDEQALKQIQAPLSIDVHLAPEDPRRADFDTRALAKLRRVFPHLQLRYTSQTSIGLFEQATPGYGEIWYQMNGRKLMSRATTAESLLESIYQLAALKPPQESAPIFRGHPLATPPTYAAAIFYAAWPLLILSCALLCRKRIG
jgi:hypothetical protein